MSHNRRLTALLERVDETAKKAREEKDFTAIFSELRDFQRTVGPIRYNNLAKWYIVGLIAGFGGSFAAAYFRLPAFQQALGDWGFAVMGVLAVALIAMLIVIGTAGSAIEEISDLIFNKDISFDNRLEEVDTDRKGGDMYRRLKKEFGDFRDRGDESRYIQRLVKGAWAGKEHSFPYEYYVFHYVRVYYVLVTKTDANGKTTTVRERRTETLHRYGLILDFPYAQGVAVTSGGGSYDYAEGFQPTSEEFSDIYQVGADTAQAAAKFLKPAVVLAFLEMEKSFDGLNVEINQDGRLNIAFSDSDVLDLERRHSIAEPDEFEKEINSHLGLPKLRTLLEFVEVLKKHNDSNF